MNRNCNRWSGALVGALASGALALVAGNAAAQAVVSASATPDPAPIGGVVSVDVLIAGVTDLTAFQFSIGFDPALLQATASTMGAFLGSGGAGTVFVPGTIDNIAGRISFVAGSMTGVDPGVNGSGVLAQVGFNSVGLGTSTLAFSDVVLLDSTLADIAFTASDGSVVVVVPEPSTAVLLGLGAAALLLRRRVAAL